MPFHSGESLPCQGTPEKPNFLRVLHNMDKSTKHHLWTKIIHTNSKTSYGKNTDTKKT